MAYNLLFPVPIVTAGDMSDDIESRIIEVRNQDNVGIQLHWEGDAVGSFGVQISMTHVEDAAGNVLVEGDWVDLPLNPSVAAAGVDDDAYIDLNQLSAAYVRLVYVATSGSGTLEAHLMAKGV